MQQFGKTHFDRMQPIPQQSLQRHESVLDAAWRELHRESVRLRLRIARQRLRDYKRGRNSRLAYDEALAWVERIEGVTDGAS